MVTDVHFIWGDTTPPEMRKVFAEASAVIHYIAERAIHDQLRHDGLMPTEIRTVVSGEKDNGEQVTLRDSDWKLIK